MQKRTMNAALTGLTVVMIGGISTGIATKVNAEPATRPVAAPTTVGGKGSASSAKKASAAERSAKSATSKKTTNARKAAPKPLLTGKTTASYFWDDGSGVNGDTGAPAGGKPMQKGLFASPSWPLHTKVRVSYNGRSMVGFVGDRGPGAPSHSGVMLDLDTYTFRYLLDGKGPSDKYNAGTGEGHLQGVTYEVLSWGSGAGTKGAPQPL